MVDEGSEQIKDVSQMFSEYFRGALGGNGRAGEALFKDGFAALASVDGNADKGIDASDAIWSQNCESGSMRLTTVKAMPASSRRWPSLASRRSMSRRRRSAVMCAKVTA